MEEGEGGGLFPKPGHKTLPRRKIRSPPQVQTREEEKEGELRGGGGKGKGGKERKSITCWSVLIWHQYSLYLLLFMVMAPVIS